MQYTGIVARPDDIAEARRLSQIASNTPVIHISANAPDAAYVAWHRAIEFVHKLALEKYNLPEIKGMYGMTTQGEFVYFKK